MSTYESQNPDSAPRRLPSLPVRAVQVVTSPGTLFARLRDRPKTWDALLLGVALVSVSNWFIPVELWEALAREQASDVGVSIGAGDTATTANIIRIAGTAGSLVFWPIWVVVSAAINSAIFIFALGYEGRYRQYLSISAHAGLIAAFGALVLLPLRIYTESVQFTLNLGAFLPLEEGLVARWLGLMDIFTLWIAVLLGIGAAAIDGERKAGPAIVAALSVVLLVTLLIASLMG